MNVLVISHLFPNPTEPLKGVFVMEFAKALSRLTTTEVIAPLPYIPISRSYATVPAQLQIEGLAIHHPRYLALPDRLFRQRWRPYYSALQETLKQIPTRADVFHVHWVYPDAFAALNYARQKGIKVVTTIHGNNAIGYFGSSRRQEIFGRALRQMDRIIAVSQDLKTKLINTFALPAEKIAVIHNGIDVAKFKPLSREEARRSLGIPINRRVLLTVARLSEEKALDRLIQAVALSRRLDVMLYIVGEGPLRQDLQRLIDQQALDNRVFLVGGVEHAHLNDWFCAADIFCLSSLHEGCPVVVHEALACGIPVVSTNVGAVPGVVNSTDYGLLCPPDDVAQLATQISQALSLTWDRAKIAAHGRQFTWEKVARETVQVYQEILA